MSSNGITTAEEADMAESGGEKVVTMMDVLQEQEEFEEDANAVLGASDEKNCTYPKGYIKRQAIYACLTCCEDAKTDPTKRAGVCLACSLMCHENHELIELYTKRNFCCDCGNSKFNSNPCQFTPNKTDLNENNNYNQNFSGLYCICHRPYPDPEATFEDEMIQCIICEDWLHAAHLEATVPANEHYSEMICKACMEKNEFLHDYSNFAVNTEYGDIDILTTNDTSMISDTISNGNLDSNKTINGLEDVDMIDSKPDDTNKNSESNFNNIEGNIDKKPEDPTDSVINSELNKNEIENDNCIEENNMPVNNKNIEHNPQSADTTVEGTEVESSTIVPEVVNAEENITNTENQPSVDNMDKDDQINEINDGQNEAFTKSEHSSSDLKNINEVNIDNTKQEKLEDSVDHMESTIDRNLSEIDKNDGKLKVNELTLPKQNLNLDNPTHESVENTISETSNGTSELPENNTENVESTSENIMQQDESNLIDSEKENNSKTEDTNNSETDTTPIIENTSTVTEKVSNEESVISETTSEMKKDDVDTTDNNITVPETTNVVELKESDEINNMTEKANDETDTSEISTDMKKDDTNTNITVSESTNIQLNESNEVNDVDMIDTTSENSTLNTDNEINKVIATSEAKTDQNTNKINDIDSTVNSTTNEAAVIEDDDKTNENKRKLSEDTLLKASAKKPKLEETKSCVRPQGVKKLYKGATFWPSSFRQNLCTCNECISMYKDLSVLFLIDPEDTVTAYETLGKERNEGNSVSQYEKGLQALSSLDRIQQINALTEYNKMRDKLLDFLKSFKDRKEVVKEDDIKAFFAGIKAKREPDGVYFCR